ncbi:MAG: glycosyltransferase family 4 protein [Actinomycetota bacterium]
MSRVLLLSNLYPSAHEPTRGAFNLQGFRALAGYCETRIVVPVLWWERTRRPLEWLAAPRSSATGIQAVYPSCWHVPQVHPLHPWTMYASVRPYVRRLARDFRFDAIVAAWACPDGVAAAHLAREYNCPLVTMVLGTDVNSLAASPALRKHLQWGLSHASRVITVSGALRDKVADLGVPASRIRVQHNGVDGDRFQIRNRAEARNRLGLSPDRRLICFVGNLVPEKGVDVLIEALARLRDSGDDVTDLALVGAGGAQEALRQQAQSLRLEQRVQFCGRRSHEEIPAWLTASDLFCLPSRREGCPNVVLEALASGRPVVASRVGGLPELVNPSNGLLAPADDSRALADALQAALLRQWRPEQLRATVPYLSWDGFGRALHETVSQAIRDHRTH